MTTLTKRTVPLLDLRALHEDVTTDILREIERVVRSQKFIMGEDVKELEKVIAEYSGVSHAIGCASGSDALFLALLAADVGPGDEVLTTPYSFFATAGAISRTGAKPVFVDIERSTFNIDPAQLAEAARHHPRAKAIIPVHLFGACADMDPILETAERYGSVVIEDGAQSIGAGYKGRKAQSMGQMGCISFFPSKNLGGFGDGGMILTSDSALGARLAALRVHGSTKKYYHEWIGINSRLDTLQAAILRVKFGKLDEWTEGRRKNAARYRELLAGAAVELPVEAPYQTRHVYNQFVIRHANRDGLKKHLAERGIGTEVYYPMPLHMQPCYQSLGYREGSFPESELAARTSLALPVHSAMSAEDLEYVADALRSFGN
jgi:dTDP-4-amino-4,6-dideoxygalactose transaminase